MAGAEVDERPGQLAELAGRLGRGHRQLELVARGREVAVGDGQPAAIVVDLGQRQRLAAGARQRQRLVEQLLGPGSLAGADLDVGRDAQGPDLVGAGAGAGQGQADGGVGGAQVAPITRQLGQEQLGPGRLAPVGDQAARLAQREVELAAGAVQQRHLEAGPAPGRGPGQGQAGVEIADAGGPARGLLGHRQAVRVGLGAASGQHPRQLDRRGQVAKGRGVFGRGA